MDSNDKLNLKDIISKQEIKKIDSDILYKIIAGVVVAVLLYISYMICNDGLAMIPVIGGFLNMILSYVCNFILMIAGLFQKLIELIVS